jgi:hypothetical protein
LPGQVVEAFVSLCPKIVQPEYFSIIFLAVLIALFVGRFSFRSSRKQIAILLQL